jgi:putative ABC transport system permease protein
LALSAVQSELNAIDKVYRQDNPANADSPEELTAQPLKEAVVGQLRASLLVLLAAVSCVLLIGCSNLMNLLLAKATARSKELAIRTALGASRWRLLQQLLTEAILLSAIGGTLGLLIALGTRRLVQALPAGTLPRAEEVSFSPGIILFSVGLTLAAGLFFGLLPALRASSGNIHESLKEGSRGTSSGRKSRRTSAIAVAAEVAIAVLLLGDAGVLVKSFGKLAGIDPGFDPNHVVAMSIALPADRYPIDKQRQFLRSLTESVQALPKVQAVAAVNALPLVGVSPLMYCCPQGFACKGIGKDPLISTRQITPDYFRAMGIPLLRGRVFEQSDTAEGQQAAIINETAANVFFHGQDPIGKWISNSRDRVPLTIVGVVKDVRYNGLNTPAFQEVYMANGQALRLYPSMTLVVRTSAEGGPLADAVRRRVAELDPDVPVADMTTMNDAVSFSISQPRLTMQIGSLFALLALLLTVFGIYGVLAYSVSQQTQEIGIRMALGATPAQVVSLVMRNGMRIVIAGMVVGLVAFFASSRLLQSLLFGVKANDPLSLLAATSAILIVGMLASYIPARNAARVSPVSAIAAKT